MDVITEVLYSQLQPEEISVVYKQTYMYVKWHVLFDTPWRFQLTFCLVAHILALSSVVHEMTTKIMI